MSVFFIKQHNVQEFCSVPTIKIYEIKNILLEILDKIVGDFRAFGWLVLLECLVEFRCRLPSE